MPSPLFFASSSIGEKRPFNKVFNIDCRPLANDHAKKDVGEKKFDKTFINTRPLADNHAEKEVDLSFAGYKCSKRVKLNRPWQIELLEWRFAGIVEIILLTAAIFWDSILCLACATRSISPKKWALREETFLVPYSKSAYSQSGLIRHLGS